MNHHDSHTPPACRRLQVVCAQKGAREHFLAPIALHRKQALARLIVDWYPPKVIRSIRGLTTGAWRRALDAYPAGLDRRYIQSHNLWGLRYRMRHMLGARGGPNYEALLSDDRHFARGVARSSMPPHDVFFGYSYASLEAIASEKERGVGTIVDQIDPGELEYRIVEEEMRLWPDYAQTTITPPQAYFDRARAEWGLADVVVVNSDWTKDALIEEGVPANKIVVLPLAYELPEAPNALACDLTDGHRRRRLTVLWLGSVIVRKGIQYLVAAAKQLQKEPIDFLVAGPIGISDKAIAEAPPNMHWLGPIPRGQASQFYQESDVFVLPTLSDGFAITQIEAMAHGVPVVATPNCGRVVEDGKTGFVVPARDSVALANALSVLAYDRDLLREMSLACRSSAANFGIDRYGESLLAALRRATCG